MHEYRSTTLCIGSHDSQDTLLIFTCLVVDIWPIGSPGIGGFLWHLNQDHQWSCAYVKIWRSSGTYLIFPSTDRSKCVFSCNDMLCYPQATHWRSVAPNIIHEPILDGSTIGKPRIFRDNGEPEHAYPSVSEAVTSLCLIRKPGSTLAVQEIHTVCGLFNLFHNMIC